MTPRFQGLLAKELKKVIYTHTHHTTYACTHTLAHMHHTCAHTHTHTCTHTTHTTHHSTAHHTYTHARTHTTFHCITGTFSLTFCVSIVTVVILNSSICLCKWPQALEFMLPSRTPPNKSASPVYGSPFK